MNYKFLKIIGITSFVILVVLYSITLTLLMLENGAGFYICAIFSVFYSIVHSFLIVGNKLFIASDKSPVVKIIDHFHNVVHMKFRSEDLKIIDPYDEEDWDEVDKKEKKGDPIEFTMRLGDVTYRYQINRDGRVESF